MRAEMSGGGGDWRLSCIYVLIYLKKLNTH